MENISQLRKKILADGFIVVEDVFQTDTLDQIITTISTVDPSHPAFRKTGGLFAIRGLIRILPEIGTIIFTPKFTELITQLFGNGFFVVKSIYFDKPPNSNWFVAYHQDITIAVKTKVNVEGFGPWTVKPDGFAVQAPLNILEKNFTIRIHLDNTDENNGALKLIPSSHLKGIHRSDTMDFSGEQQVICPVKRGSIMIMRPLLMHASGRTMNNERRRVIHLEFSSQKLPTPLKWAEYFAW